jgi:hypothetical protein
MGATLSERTGIHYCIRCRAEVEREAYFANDHVCDGCASRTETYPLGTPGQPCAYRPIDRLRNEDAN